MSHYRPDRRTVRLSAALGALTLCAVACTGSTPSSPAAPPGPFPPRPYVIDVTKIDPCSALTPAQARQRDARKGPPRTVDLGVGRPSKACGWSNDDEKYRYNFQTIEADAALALQAPGTNSVISVDGFGAVLNVSGESNVTGSGIPQLCQITIDVNTNQSIRVQVGGADTTTYGSQAEIKESCDRVRVLAHDVLTTLSSQQT